MRVLEWIPSSWLTVFWVIFWCGYFDAMSPENAARMLQHFAILWAVLTGVPLLWRTWQWYRNRDLPEVL